MVNLAEKKSRTMRWPGLGGWRGSPWCFLLSSSIILDKAPLVLGSDPVGIQHGSANGYRSVGKRDALRITSVPRILGHADLLGRRFKCERWQWRAALGHMGSPENSSLYVIKL
jgi:hypothetical protein